MLENARILVFAKAPVAGAVKTRLIPAIGAERAARLHEMLLRRTLTTICHSKLAPVELWCAPSIDHPSFALYRSEFALTLCTQHGNDLGARMLHAAQTVLQGAEHVIITGTDCPGLSASDLRDSLHALSEGADAVLGPADDGGYWLLGLRHCDPSLFNDICWGSDTVLEETRKRLHRLNWRWHELPVRWDVDRPEDLARLSAECNFDTA